MTTVTITISDPSGVDSNLLFPSASPCVALTAGTNPTGDLQFRRVVNGVTVNPIYIMEIFSNTLVRSDKTIDISGATSSMKVNLVTPTSEVGAELVHATFSQDPAWVGGVHIGSYFGLTVDVLMNIIMQRTSVNLIVIGNTGNDILNGSFLDDTLRGGAGADILKGGEGIDTASYEGSTLGVTINLLANTASRGDAAGDKFSSIENIIGTNLGDRIIGDNAANFIDGALGFDMIDGGAGNDAIFGRNGGGVLRGGAGNDRVDGGIDDDTIYGGTGNDELRVGTGSNFAYGQDGDDFLLGDTGIDRLYGGAGADILDGFSGNDVLDGGVGADAMSGGNGASRYYVNDPGDTAFDFGFNDGDRVLTSVSFALTPSSNIERLETTNAAGTGALNLTGNEVAQTILGNAGSNILNGREGADTLQGFGGSDSFLFDTALGATNIDRIVDFNVAADTIRLENAAFTGLAAGMLAASAFFAGTAAHDSSDRILYNRANGALSFDRDGLGGVAAVRFATVGTDLALTNADFRVV